MSLPVVVDNMQVFFYTATVIRQQRQVERLGTVRARDELHAIDRVYQMAKSVWDRTCIEVLIVEAGTGTVLASSKCGVKKKEKDSTTKAPIYVPEKPQDAVRPHELGTHFMPPTFGRLIVS